MDNNTDNTRSLNEPGSCMLSTTDNPYNYFDSFIDWYMYDMEKGHNSCAYLDRIANVSDKLSGPEYEAEIERAIDEIISNDFLNIYIKVFA